MGNDLLRSPADVLRLLLVDADLGTVPSTPPGSWPVYVSNEPSTPDEVVIVYDTQGTDDGRVMRGELQQHYGVQVRVRSRTHADGFAKATAIRSWLSETLYAATATIDGTSYTVHCASGIGQVLALGVDSGASKRSLFTLNCTLTLTRN